MAHDPAAGPDSGDPPEPEHPAGAVDRDDPDAAVELAKGTGDTVDTVDTVDPGDPVDTVDPGRPKRSKADRLAERAEKLREREAARTAERAARAAEGRPRRPTGWIIATAAVSAAAVALATLLIIVFLSWHHQRQLDDARAGALKAARTYAVAFGTYDYQHLDADFAKTSQLLTPSFAQRYKTTSEALAKTFAAYKTKVTASIPSGGAAVISASTSKAQVLVLLDQVISNSQSKTPTINRNRLKVTLVRSHGRWLVSRTDAT